MSMELAATRRLGSFSYEAEFAADREILALFGHSGAGKSVTLQMISGLLRPDSGRIAIGGETVFDAATGVNLPPQLRRTGYVVQELALFEHLSVAENIAFGLPRRRDRRRRVAELLELLSLDGFEDRRPRTLSGGQRQRVALARALAREAPLLLLDEPFSALDDALRHGMRRELLRLRADLGLTILFVTHDLREAHFLADRIAVFDAGRILQVDTREEVFRRPASRRVAELTGVANIWRGTVAASAPGMATIVVNGALLRAETGCTPLAVGQPVDVIVRAERINLRRDLAPNPYESFRINAQIVSEFAFGSSHTLHMAPTGPGPERMEVDVAARPYDVLGIRSRKTFDVEIDPCDVHVVPTTGPETLTP